MSGSSLDWSEEKYREMLVYQRKHMWRDDTLEIFANWAGLKHGMGAADIGCGLGFLGYALWGYFGQAGHYVGVDTNLTLLKDAYQASHEWATGGTASFVNGDAYNIPLPDNSFDMVICQTLLLHLSKPEHALREMIRILKPGGLILCLEPDNLSSMLSKRKWTLPEPNLDEMMLMLKIVLISNRGRIKLGRGDSNIGVQVVHMLGKLGMTEIDARLNDDVWFVEPPYEGEIQQHRLKIIKRNMLDSEHTEYWREKNREEFIAGGGDEKEFDQYIDYVEHLKPLIKQQFEDGTYAGCGSSDMYMIKGRKPIQP